MRLHIYAVPIVLTAFFLALVFGLKASEGEFRSGMAPSAMTFVQPGVDSDSLAFPGAIGMGRHALAQCRQDVRDGLKTLNVHVVDPNTYTNAYPYSYQTGGLTDIIYNETSDN